MFQGKILKCLKIFFFIIIFFLSNLSNSFTKINKFKLSDETIISFYDYISSSRKPLDKFLITEDGTSSFVWICPQTLCFPARENFYLKPCSKLNYNKTCKIFVVNRKIKLINSDKVSKNLRKFKRGDTLAEVKNKPKKLGFVD
tara:strand:- start:239 stop:667 length:429 start_codon:yes stop_codon:yes gene_type:complete